MTERLHELGIDALMKKWRALMDDQGQPKPGVTEGALQEVATAIYIFVASPAGDSALAPARDPGESYTWHGITKAEWETICKVTSNHQIRHIF